MEMHLLNFANDRFRAAQVLALDLAKLYGVKHLHPFTAERFREQFPDFYEANSEILKQERGCGYWLWKPFLILNTLKSIPPGEVLMYCDSGALLVSDPAPLYELTVQHDQLFFNMPLLLNRAWTKRDIFVKLGCDESKFWDRPQVKAQCCLWKHCQSSIDHLSEWLRYCQDPQLITDSPSIAPNFPEFKENRHDQSILSVLVTKWGNEIFRDPSQEGLIYQSQFSNSPYGFILSAVGIKAGRKSQG